MTCLHGADRSNFDCLMQLLGFGSRSSFSSSVVILLLGLRRNREDNGARARSERNVFRELEILSVEGHVRFEVGDVQFENRRDACRLSSEHEITSFLREETALSLHANRETGKLDRDANLNHGIRHQRS